MAFSAECSSYSSQTNVVGHVGDAELYESDLKTLNKKHAVNEKVRYKDIQKHVVEDLGPSHGI